MDHWSQEIRMKPVVMNIHKCFILREYLKISDLERKAKNKQLLAFYYVGVKNDIDKQKSWILKYRESKI